MLSKEELSNLRGNGEAFAAVVDAYDASLKRVCFVVTGDPESASDAVQNTWEIAWRKASRLRDPRRLRQWLFAVALNESRQHVRRQRRLTPLVERDSEQAFADPDLAIALSKLSTSDRQLLALLVVAGLTSAEAGQLMGLSPEGVRTRKARLLRRLREELNHGSA